MSENDKILEVLVDFANALESACVNLKRYVARVKDVKEALAVKEETFNILKFESQQGAKIGPYGVAYKKNNLPDKFTQAYNILRKNNATISSRYHGEAYVYAYWLYGENKIYRQRLKK
jgi:hypothetical protein